jgi:NADH-ubiquinone oxidoreductase chain 4
MVLAGVVLKLGTFGFVQFLLGYLARITQEWIPLIASFSLVTLVLSSLSILRQVDSKAFIALRSVAHIAVVTMGFCLYRLDGEIGGLALGLAHGLVSPALFLLFGGRMYDRYHSRIIRSLRGIGRILPITFRLVFVASLFNAGVPLSFN